MNGLRIGTRGSALALAQTKLVQAQLQAAHPEVNFELVFIKTTGDQLTATAKESAAWGKGLFTKELELALAQQEIDVAVHSLKDLPTQFDASLALGAVPRRVEPWDVLITKEPAQGLMDLKPGAIVATGSARRQSQLRWKRADVHVVDIRGNIDTRLRKFRESTWDAIILAAAGLERLQPDLDQLFVKSLTAKEMLPAPGQGALGLQVRANDTVTRERVVAVHDIVTAQAVQAERAFLQALGGGCEWPVGSYAEIEGDRLTLQGIVWLEGSVAPRVGEVQGLALEARALGERLAEQLREPIA
jgi:hydroxymethylbilane synthase